MSQCYELNGNNPLVAALNQNINALIVHGGDDANAVLYLVVIKRWQHIAFEGDEQAYIGQLISAIEEAKREFNDTHDANELTETLFAHLTSSTAALKVMRITNTQTAAILEDDDAHYPVSSRYTDYLPDSPIKVFLGRIIQLQEKDLSDDVEDVLDSVIKGRWQHIAFKGNKNAYIDTLLMALEKTQGEFEQYHDYYDCYHDTFSTLKFALRGMADDVEERERWSGHD